MRDQDFFQWVDEVIVPNLAMAVVGFVPTLGAWGRWRVELTPCLGEMQRTEGDNRATALLLAKEKYEAMP